MITLIFQSGNVKLERDIEKNYESLVSLPQEELSALILEFMNIAYERANNFEAELPEWGAMCKMVMKGRPKGEDILCNTPMHLADTGRHGEASELKRAIDSE